MDSLQLASKANQAATLPAALAHIYANRTNGTDYELQIKDVDALEGEGKRILRYQPASGSALFDEAAILDHILESRFVSKPPNRLEVRFPVSYPA